jgi:hypothetical protein
MALTRRSGPGAQPALAHYLATGCWAGGEPPDLDVFRLAGAVLRAGGRAELRELWTAHGAEVRRDHRGPTYCELVLANRAPHQGRLCPEHESRQPAEPADDRDDPDPDDPDPDVDDEEGR